MPKQTCLLDFHHSSLCFRNSTFRLHFLEKYIPKYLTFAFQFCIFVVLKVHHRLHRLSIYFHPDVFNSPRSTRSSTEVSISHHCHSERSLRSEDKLLRGARKISSTSTKKSCAVFPRSFAVALDDNRGERENSVELRVLCGEKENLR